MRKEGLYEGRTRTEGQWESRTIEKKDYREAGRKDYRKEGQKEGRKGGERKERREEPASTTRWLLNFCIVVLSS